MRADVGGLDVAARVVGIGLAMAAVGAAMQLAELPPRFVVLVGTCGLYRATDGKGGSSRSGTWPCPPACC